MPVSFWNCFHHATDGRAEAGAVHFGGSHAADEGSQLAHLLFAELLQLEEFVEGHLRVARQHLAQDFEAPSTCR